MDSMQKTSRHGVQASSSASPCMMALVILRKMIGITNIDFNRGLRISLLTAMAVSAQAAGNKQLYAGC
ncbi:MAG: hypothetical protein E6Q88_11700 [Lysobacteraceae bacterium]|nr:MAG: hypothetical protein E6Q88_11700 [Xanthomonadaceae bacterium]